MAGISGTARSGRIRWDHFVRAASRSVLALVAFATMALVPVWCRAQGARTYPASEYFLARTVFFEGEFESAGKAYRDAARQGLRTVNTRWVDSICYHAMIGECLYQMGRRADALEQYDAALKLYLTFPDWLAQVQFPPQATDAVRRSGTRPPTWGQSGRRVQPGQFPERASIPLTGLGAPTPAGIFIQSELLTIYPGEIARATCLALRRRRELLGKFSPHDPLTAQLLAALSRRPAQPNHWTQVWVGTELGLALAAAGQTAQAMTELQRSLAVNDQWDHPLTATGLLELGRLAFDQKQFDVAGTMFFEASLAAAQFEQYELVEEALRWGAINHSVSGKAGPYAPLEPAVVWAKRSSRFLEASLFVSAAEVLVHQSAGGRNAGGLLDQARRALGRRGNAAGELACRINYATAMIQSQAGNLASSQTSLNLALAYRRTNAPRLFQVELVDRAYRAGAITDRAASELYATLLTDPPDEDWLVFPLDALAAITSPMPAAAERWLAIAQERKKPDQMVEIVELIRRRRFHLTTEMGGRLLAIRWLLGAPDISLSPLALQQKQRLLTSYPALSQGLGEIDRLRSQLNDLPLLADADQAQSQSELFVSLAKTSQTLEVMLRDVALRREPIELVFPPLRSTKEIQDRLAPRQIVVSFFELGRSVMAFSITRDRLDVWRIADATELRRELQRLLKEIGLTDRNQPIGSDRLQGDTWQQPAVALRRLLFDGGAIDWQKFEEFIVVPDTWLWYVPWDALPADPENPAEPLAARVRLRCAPTVGLCLPDGRGQRPQPRTWLVTGDLHPQFNDVSRAAALEPLEKGTDRVWRVPESPTNFVDLRLKCAERLWVLGEIDVVKSVYETSLLPPSAGKAVVPLQSFLNLPWGGPEQILVPGLHTAAESALRQNANGDELFLMACGLMAAGSRTIVLSRWSTGGQLTYDLVREFTQQLSDSTPSDAWQRAILLTMQAPVDVEREPRVRLQNTDRPITGQSPFFWGGYVLIDSTGVPAEPPKPKTP